MQSDAAVAGGARSTIAPRTGVAFPLSAGQRLVVTDPCGEQVADMLAFSSVDVRESISSGRTFDYAAFT